jgi:hypothetical protein
MSDSLVYGLVIGISVGGFIYAALSKQAHDRTSRRALAVAAFGVGASITWWLYRHPAEIEAIMDDIVEKGVAVILAALGASLIFWKSKGR